MFCLVKLSRATPGHLSRKKAPAIFKRIKQRHHDIKDQQSVKNPRPEDVALSGAPSKGTERVPSDPAVVGVMEYGSNGLELTEGS